MIPNHNRFIEAILEKKKVCVRFYSKADSGVLDRVCAPMDYGPGGETNGLNRYWLWDYGSNAGSHVLGLLPEQVLDLRLLGEAFDPTHLDATPTQWSISRDWGSQPPPMVAPIGEPALPTAAAAAPGGEVVKVRNN